MEQFHQLINSEIQQNETSTNSESTSNGTDNVNTSNQISQFVSALPPIDRRRNDTRIRYAFENH